MPQQVRYRHDASLPYWLVRGRDTAISIGLVDDETGDDAAPTAATCSLLEPDGTEHVIAGASVSGGRLTATVLASTVAVDEDLSSRWVAKWTGTIGGIAYTFEAPAHVVRREPLAPVTPGDLRTRHQVLRTLRTKDKTTAQLLSDAIRVAFDDWLRRILDTGKDPERVMSSAGCFEFVINAAMAHAFLDAASSLNSSGQLAELGAFYDRKAERAWNTAKLTYDSDGDGLIASSETGNSGPSVLMVGCSSWRRTS